MKAITAIAALLLLAAGMSNAGAQTQCAADNEKRVTGAAECLVIHTFRFEPLGDAPRLAVFIHGDHSDGSAVTSNVRLARDLNRPGTVAVAIIRPGYFDADRNTSSGHNYNRIDSYTAGNIDAVAAAIATLKTHHKAARTVLVGHSGGSAYTGVILGRHPDLVDAGLLLSCPCDIRAWRLGRSPWLQSESPINYAAKVPATKPVIAITANDDTNTTPALAQAYIAALKQRGVPAEYIGLARGGHNGTQGTPEMREALGKLLGG